MCKIGFPYPTGPLHSIQRDGCGHLCSLDVERRKQLGYEIQRYILGQPNKEAPGALCRLDYVAPAGGYIIWPYVKNATTWPWFGNSYWLSQVWLDKSNAEFHGRAS